MYFKNLLSKYKKNEEDLNDYNIRISNLNGILQIAAANLVLPFAIMFAKRLYATDFQIALMSSLPAIVSVGVIIPGAIYVKRCINKQAVTGRLFILSRLFYLLFAIIPLLTKQYRASIFILLYGFMNLPGSIAVVAWQSFIADLFPPFLRAHALALRNRLSAYIGIIITLIAGWILYYIPKNDVQRLFLYQIFFCIAFIVSLFEVYSFYKHKLTDSKKCAIADQTTSAQGNLYFRIKNAYLELKSSKRFITFIVCAFVFHISWYMAWPLFSLYEIDFLHSNELWTSIIVTVNGISQATSFIYWSKLSQKRSNGFALAIAIMGMALCPLLYPLTNSLYILLPVSVIGGVATSGVSLILLNTLFEVSPDKNRTLYIAYYNTMINLTLTFSPFIGIALKNKFNITIAFFIAFAARVFAGIFFIMRYKKEERT